MLTVKLTTSKFNFFPASLSILLFLLWATPAWAVQSHGGSEGLVSHQIGHILFTIGMIILLIRQRNWRISGPGWQEFKIFLTLLILWNILAFSGHWMREVIAKTKMIKENGHVVAFKVESFFDVIFYLTRLDHLILVPAFCFMLLAFKRWDQGS